MSDNIAIVILAAGKGTRMKSEFPKVLHKVGGKSMLEEVLATASHLHPEKEIVVLGFGAEKVQAILPPNIDVAIQKEQLGTGHAMLQAVPALKGFNGSVVVLYGDVPLLSVKTLESLVNKHKETNAAVTVLTALIDDPTGYGRIVRDEVTRSFLKIVEHKDASDKEKEINEINSGVYCFTSEALNKYLHRLTPQNKQGEYYLTDVLGLALKDGKLVETYITEDQDEILGANDRVQLAELADLRNQRKLKELMLSGVTIFDPKNTYIDNEVIIAPDAIIQPGTFLYGKCNIGPHVVVGPNTTLIDTEVEKDAKIVMSYVEKSVIQSGAQIGPFAYIRHDCTVGEGSKVGSFVEIKNTTVGHGSKVPHLSYLGDTNVGKNVNIGAGTITCNFDGVNKHNTVINDNAFVGSNSSIVAPVKVGENSVLGAGSVITKDVPNNALAVARSKQINYEDWSIKKKKREDF